MKWLFKMFLLSGIKLCFSDSHGLSAELPSSLGACVCPEQAGSLHTEIVNALCIVHKNYPVFFSYAAALCYILYHAGSKDGRTAGHENVLSSVYVLDLVLRVNIHKPTRKAEQINPQWTLCCQGLTSLCTHSTTSFRVSSSVSALPRVLQHRLARSLATVISLLLGGCSSHAASPGHEDHGSGCRDDTQNSRGMRGIAATCHVLGKAC